MDAQLGAMVAQTANWRRMGDRFSGSAAEFSFSDVAAIVGVCLAVAGVIALLRWLAWRQQFVQKRPKPGRLFRQLCRTHGLEATDRRRLRRLAELAGCQQPAEAFVRPDLFRGGGVPEPLRGEADQLEALAAVLFADLRSDAPTSSEDGSSERTTAAAAGSGGAAVAVVAGGDPSVG